MNPSKNGLSSSAKTGIVVVVVVLVLGAAYLVPSLSKGGGAQATTAQTEGPNAPAPFSTLSLFGYFPQMSLTVDANDVPNAVTQNSSYSYSVQGKTTLNSTQYLTVEFSTSGAINANSVIAFFNSTGGIPRVDVVGVRNYTGPGAYVLAQAYTTAYGLIPAITNNATILSILSKTSSTTMSLGPTKMNVTTYSLGLPTDGFTKLTVKYATIPGTDIQMAVYLSEEESDGSTTLIQVTSLTT